MAGVHGGDGPRANPWLLAAVYADVAGARDAARACWALNRSFKATFAVESSTDMDLHLSHMETSPGAPSVYHAFFDEVCHTFARSAATRDAQGTDGAGAQLRAVPFYVRANLPAPVALRERAGDDNGGGGGGAAAPAAPVSETSSVVPLCADAVFVFPHAVFDQLDLMLTAAQPRMALAVRALPGVRVANGNTTTADAWLVLRAQDLVEITGARGGYDPAASVRATATEWAVSGRIPVRSEALLCGTHHVVTLATSDQLRGRGSFATGARIISDFAYDEAAFRRVCTLAGEGAYLSRFVWFNVQRRPLPTRQTLTPACVPVDGSDDGSGSGGGGGDGSPVEERAAGADKQTPVPVPVWIMVATDCVRAQLDDHGAFVGAVLADAPSRATLLHVIPRTPKRGAH